jgi:amino acid transporter
MYLNIILTILVLILLGIISVVIFWWVKFGKELFATMKNMNKILPTDSKKTTTPNNLGNLLSDLDKMMNQFKKNK